MRKDRSTSKGILLVTIIIVMVALSANVFAFADKGAIDGRMVSEGFLGRQWGADPSEFKGARHIANIDGHMAVYTADADLLPILGTTSAFSSPRMIFTKEGGLQKVYIAFDESDYAAVEKHLIQVLGNPSPIMYELWVGRIDFSERSEWFVGKSTRIVLTLRSSGASIEISKRDSAVPGGRDFEAMLSAAQLQQAREYEQQHQFVEASSVYQELLNGTGSYRLFTSLVQEQLAVYSRLEETTDYLFEEQGLVFRGLKNQFADNTGQLWIRIDFGPSALEEMQKRKPTDAGPHEGMATISAVLCRVRAVPDRNFKLVEQVWLDGTNRVIGGRPAWMPQDSGWPASYIKQVCERFLRGWFSFESGALQRTRQ